jgi:hypothetical protein
MRLKKRLDKKLQGEQTVVKRRVLKWPKGKIASIKKLSKLKSPFGAKVMIC